MTQNSSESKICPNCGYTAVEHYCARCGQETHLHKDTFGALVMHFAGHYLHYDSKFWQTLRALWFSPGLLTNAYWEEKRMRYIPPISLYIFVSFVYFFIGTLTPDNFSKTRLIDISTKERAGVRPPAGTIVSHNMPETSKGLVQLVHEIPTAKNATKFLGVGLWDVYQKHKNIDEYLNEQVTHLTPKVFFLLIPLMAFVLKILFFRRKELLFVNHVIFSLHYHAFWFSIWTLLEFCPMCVVRNVLLALLVIISAVYMMLALRNVYHVSWLKGVACTVLIGITYLISLIIGVLMLLYLVMATA